MKRIIIIEDDVAIAEIERDYLEIEGYEVEIFHDGKSGIEAVYKGDFNLIVLDVMLPLMDGFEVLKLIRKRSDLPVLMVTAKSLEVDKVRGLGLGADDYITKPFTMNEFVARVNAHLKRYDRLTLNNKPIKKNNISINGLEIDLEARRVFIQGDEVILANKEFDLLVFLAENPNKVFSKDQLLNQIWGYESFTDNATITVHIKKLRHKIEKDPQNPKYIETVWGVGYRFKI
ncbi:MAG: response regulator transcription factor [Oscillospiraceae bacterium]|nr:response regulator transcription factor [Oscillospiraceae bacterium]